MQEASMLIHTFNNRHFQYKIVRKNSMCVLVGRSSFSWLLFCYTWSSQCSTLFLFSFINGSVLIGLHPAEHVDASGNKTPRSLLLFLFLQLQPLLYVLMITVMKWVLRPRNLSLLIKVGCAGEKQAVAQSCSSKTLSVVLKGKIMAFKDDVKRMLLYQLYQDGIVYVKV